MESKSKQRVLVFGATGAIGEALIHWFATRAWEVTAVTRSAPPSDISSPVKWVSWDPFAEKNDVVPKSITLPFSAVVWAQGQNFNDNIHNFDAAAHDDMYRANVVFIMKTLHDLLA